MQYICNVITGHFLLQVLEVHEQMEKSLESDLESEELAEGEKALVREMCNVYIYLCLNHYFSFPLQDFKIM